MSEMNQRQRSDIKALPSHEIKLEQRKQMRITGVREVNSFDTNTVELDTVCGIMIVDGIDLKLGTLDTDSGVVELSGTVTAINYSDGSEPERKGFFKRMLG